MSHGAGLREVGYFDCAGGGQVVVTGDVAFVAHMHAPNGTTLVDVARPLGPAAASHARGPDGDALPQGPRGQRGHAGQP